MPIPHVALGMPRAVEVFKQIDDRHARIQVAQKKRAAKAAVPNDQIGPDVRVAPAASVKAVAVADRVFKGSRAEMGIFLSRRLALVLNFLETFDDPAGGLTDECAFPPRLAEIDARRCARIEPGSSGGCKVRACAGGGLYCLLVDGLRHLAQLSHRHRSVYR